MNKFYLEKLEYNKILEILSSYSKTYIGKELSLSLKPSNIKDKVSKTLKETSEANTLIQRKGALPISFIEDLTVFIKVVRGNACLSYKGLLELSKILKMSKELKQYFYSNDGLDLDIFPILDNYFSSLYSNLDIEKTIFTNILDETTIDDNASKKLFSIRKNIRKLEQDIKNKLNSFIHSSTYSKYIQEAVVTIRQNRYVIPVKQEYRSQIKGFIHDFSASGSTVFIEPTAIFELNNEINNLKFEENLEIERILKQYTQMFEPIINEIENDIRIIGRLDFIFAKASYALDLDAIEPILNDKKSINLIGARHPLIDRKKVVPIDINLGIDFSCLVITGPNTGGKTVTLKTVGLLCLMAMSGLHIPAKSGSFVYVFDNIFADIGDEQSIQESLSTFSSHMTNIIEILKNSTSESLILLDELCSGTDPFEGSSLAISLLESFYNNLSLILATTHYPEIKRYSLVTKGFKNASCEFDVENLCPTYKLLLGIPGKSNAFEISKKLGLDLSIINRAKSFSSEDLASIEDLLKSIYDEKLIIEKEKIETEKNLNQVTLLKKSLEKDNSDLENKSKQLVEDAKQEARQILLDAKDNATRIIREMKDKSNNTKDLENLRNDLNESIKNISFIENAHDIHKGIALCPPSIENIQPGANVFVINLNQNGVVLSYPNNKNTVQVQIGNMKTNVKLDNLQLINNTQNNTNIVGVMQSYNSPKKGSKSNFKSKTISTEINVIGLTVDEALPIIDKYLDDVYLSSLNSIRIVHGKGTGKLRSSIHLFLKKNSHVKSFRLGTFGEGEMGVTVVEMKK